MKVQNMTCISLSMGLQGLMKKLFASPSALILTSGFSKADSIEFVSYLSSIKELAVKAEESSSQLNQPVEVGTEEPYVTGHPNFTVDYIGRAIEAACYFILSDCKSASLMDTGLLPDEADMIITMIDDIEIAFRKEAVPYPRLIVVPPESPNEAGLLPELLTSGP